MSLPARPKELVLIAAVAQNGVIGIENRLPWKLPEDMRFFRQQTTGHTVIMGRKTFDSLGKPLPNRRNIVVTRNPAWQAEGAEVAHSLDAALALCAGDDKAFVIGGEELYRLSLPQANTLLITRVGLEPEGDARFPDIDPATWHVANREEQIAADGTRFAFVTYRRSIGTGQ